VAFDDNRQRFGTIERLVASIATSRHLSETSMDKEVEYARCLDTNSVRALSELQLDDAARARLDVLAQKANEGQLAPEKAREYERFIEVSDIISTLRKLLEDWSEPEEELRYFRAENYTARPSGPRGQPAAIDHDLKVGTREMVGASAGFNVALHLLDKVARTDATVLFLGDSGVGKGVFARELHKRSNRADKTLVAVNCAAIPETLMEGSHRGQLQPP
jgi:transcriptional regulator with GAF, ATPase, and Fis domain